MKLLKKVWEWMIVMAMIGGLIAFAGLLYWLDKVRFVY